MTFRSELDSIDTAIAKLRRDMKEVLGRMHGPRFIFARANLNRAESLLNAAGGHIRESWEHVPEKLDTDD